MGYFGNTKTGYFLHDQIRHERAIPYAILNIFHRIKSFLKNIVFLKQFTELEELLVFPLIIST